MSDQYIEKSFIYLILLSLLIHFAVFLVIIYMPSKKVVVQQEPLMVDLEELPLLGQNNKSNKVNTEFKSSRRNRVEKQTAPKGEMPKERSASNSAYVSNFGPHSPHESKNNIHEKSDNSDKTKSFPGKDLLIKKSQHPFPELARLYPSASGMAMLEENYRKKYESEIEDGETKFLNTDDILFGSFLRRFETAVYGVWVYPSEAARLGIEGVTPVRITFNRKGEIENVQLLESSGSNILDEEVFRALRLIGPLGSLPKGYNKDKFNLIAFFQYGIIRGSGRGMIH